MRVESPVARKSPYVVSARCAARNAAPDQERRTAAKTAATPAKPHSSPIAGSTRSVLPAGITPGSPHPGPLPVGPPVAKRPKRVRQLIAAVDVVVPRREPHIDALHHGVRRARAIPDGDRRHHQDDAAIASAGRPRATREHRQKHEQRDQRRPQVFQHEKEHERDARRHQHRKHMLRRAPRVRPAARFSRRSRSRSQLRVK